MSNGTYQVLVELDHGLAGLLELPTMRVTCQLACPQGDDKFPGGHIGWTGITTSGMAAVSWLSESLWPFVATYDTVTGQLMQQFPDLVYNWNTYGSASMATVGCFGAVSASEERLVLTFCKGHRYDRECWVLFLNGKTGKLINHMQPVWTTATPHQSWHAQDKYAMLQSPRQQATHAALLFACNPMTLSPPYMTSLKD